MRGMVIQTSHLSREVSVSSDHCFLFKFYLGYCSVTKEQNRFAWSLKVQFITIKHFGALNFYFKYTGLEMAVNYRDCRFPWEQGQTESLIALAWNEVQHSVDEELMGVFSLWSLECSSKTWERDRTTWPRKLIVTFTTAHLVTASMVVLPSQGPLVSDKIH